MIFWIAVIILGGFILGRSSEPDIWIDWLVGGMFIFSGTLMVLHLGDRKKGKK